MNEEIVKEKLAIAQKKSTFRKVFAYNHPKWMVYGGFFCSLTFGCTQPVFGIFFSKILGILTLPREYVELVLQEDYHDFVRSGTNHWVYFILGLAGVALFAGFFSAYFFAVVGENVTLKIRQDLYRGVLRKHIGWHDDRDNAPSVLTSAMAQDTACVNGVASESLATVLNSTFSILAGVGIGFYYCW